jgi:ribosomal protein S18 acetylase RimI-like enzyme
MPEGMHSLSRRFDPIFDILGQLDAQYRKGELPRKGEYLHLFLLGVARTHAGRGIAQGLVTACLEHAAPRGFQVAVTEATNRTSQHIFRKQGFVERVRGSYLDHRFDDRAYFTSIAEEHGGPILFDKQLAR